MHDSLVFRSLAEWLKPRQMRMQLLSRCFITAHIGVVSNLIEILWWQYNLTSIVGYQSKSFGRLESSISLPDSVTPDLKVQETNLSEPSFDQFSSTSHIAATRLDPKIEEGMLVDQGQFRSNRKSKPKNRTREKNHSHRDYHVGKRRSIGWIPHHRGPRCQFGSAVD